MINFPPVKFIKERHHQLFKLIKENKLRLFFGMICADAGYADTEDLEKVDSHGIQVIVPSQRQASRGGENPFSKSAFTYDADKDCYTCPQGHTLKLEWVDPTNGKRHYIIHDRRLCHSCEHYGACTTAEKGRKVVRLPNEQVKERLEAQYEEAQSQQIYQRRKSRVEHPFGHIKRNLKTPAFLLRGRDGVQAETSVLGTCFNVARMITIFGVHELLGRLKLLRVTS